MLKVLPCALLISTATCARGLMEEAFTAAVSR